MARFIARGRAAWICSLVLGVILVVVGIVVKQTIVAIVGGAFALFGLVFLILSFVTGGRTD